MGLALLFGVPLASIATIGFRNEGETRGDDSLRAVEEYCLALLLPLLVTVAYFTASVIGEGPYESLGQLHMRYYNFMFPLFLVVVAGQISVTGRARRNVHGVGAALVVLFGLAAYAMRSLLRLYSPSLIDSPELYGVTRRGAVFVAVGILGVLSLIVWSFNRRRGAQLFLFVLMPVSVLCSARIASSELRWRLAGDDYDKAGAFTHAELDKDERSKLVVVGSELATLYRVLFYVDDTKTTLAVLPPGAPFDRSAVDSDQEWVLLPGEHAVPSDVTDRLAGEGYVLFRLPAKSANGKAGAFPQTVDFRHPYRFGLVKRISGMSVPQPFGRWSDSREVQIEMASALPPTFELKLTAFAFGPNTQLPFTIRIGEETKTFQAGATPSEVSLPFTTDGKKKLITIEVPQPTSPKQRGLSSDDRELNIALREMKIVEPKSLQR